MLYIHYTRPENTIWSTSVYFDNSYEDEWMKDDIVKQMILDIDKSTVIDADCVKSPVLGAIPITKISQGVKTLILMLKRPDKVMWASACGDNCAEWIIKISKMMDLHIVLEHIMNFPHDFEAICVDNGKRIKTEREYMENALDMFYGKVD